MLYWLLLILVALLFDLIAGHIITARIPSIDVFLNNLTGKITSKLDRRERTENARRTRGMVTLLVFLPVFFLCGELLNILARSSAGGTAVALLVLIPLIGQRKAWGEHTKAGRHIAAGKPLSDANTAAQNTSQKIILKFSSAFIPGIILFSIGGFAFLLPMRFLASLLHSDGITNNAPSPFFKYARLLHELIFLPIAVLSAFIFGLAHFFVPNTNLRLFSQLPPNKTLTLASQFIPLNIIANGLSLNFLRKENGKGSTIKVGKWIGPEEGRAILTAKDMRSIWLVVLVAFGLSIVAILMVFVFLSVTLINDP